MSMRRRLLFGCPGHRDGVQFIHRTGHGWTVYVPSGLRNRPHASRSFVRVLWPKPSVHWLVVHPGNVPDPFGARAKHADSHRMSTHPRFWRLSSSHKHRRQHLGRLGAKRKRQCHDRLRLVLDLQSPDGTCHYWIPRLE